MRISQRWPEVLVTHEGETAYESGFFCTDPAFFDVFSFPLLEGDPRSALARPFTVVLSQSMAQKYFGDTSPLGETITLKGLWDAHDFEVTGVAEEVPRNSHFTFNFLASFATRYTTEPGAENIDSWGHVGDLTYVLLDTVSSQASLESKMPAFFLHHERDRFANRDLPDLERIYTLQPISDIHLYSAMKDELEPGGDVRYLYIFSVVALIILLTACINYTNLAAAQSAYRAREVGVRKVMGARRWRLVAQFLGESAVLTLAALVLGLALVWLCLPAFNRLAGKELTLGLQSGTAFWLVVLGVGALVSLAAGLYRVSFSPVSSPCACSRASSRVQGASNQRFRSTLIVTQFAAAVVLIVTTLTVYRQLDYMKQKRLGLNPEQVVMVFHPQRSRQTVRGIQSRAAAAPKRGECGSLRCRATLVNRTDDDPGAGELWSAGRIRGRR